MAWMLVDAQQSTHTEPMFHLTQGPGLAEHERVSGVNADRDGRDAARAEIKKPIFCG